MNNRGSILIVEDDASIRRLCARMLKNMHLSVLEAENGNRALACLEQEGPVSAVLLDLHLPDITGLELADWIRGQSPGTPIIYFSGSTSQEIPPQELQRADTHRLHKPFTRDSLRSVIQDCLGEPTP